MCMDNILNPQLIATYVLHDLIEHANLYKILMHGVVL